MEQIAVIGAGTMGNGITHVFAQYGYRVCLVDINPVSLKKGVQTIEKNLGRMVERDKLSREAAAKALANINPGTDLAKGVERAGMVVEAATERIDIKKELFRQIDQFAPAGAILASNTSSISITEIAAVTSRPGQVIGMHFMNPVPLMQLVEVIRGYNTSDEVVREVLRIARDLDKTPTEVLDYPGFVANRILMPMINEAIETLYHGVAGVAEIDTVMKLGMAHPMGPLQLADFIGLDVCLSIMKVLYDGLRNPKYAPCPLLCNMVAAGKLGVKSGEGFYDYSQTRKAEQVSARFA